MSAAPWPAAPADRAPLAPAPLAPDRESCAELAMRLAFARRPLIVAGNGARAAARELSELARRLSIPVVTTPHAKGIFPESDPLHLGLIGLGGHSSAVSYLTSRPDVVCIVGSRLGNLPTDGWALPLSGTEATIQIDREPLLIGRNYPVTLGIVSDAALACARRSTTSPPTSLMSSAVRESNAIGTPMPFPTAFRSSQLVFSLRFKGRFPTPAGLPIRANIAPLPCTTWRSIGGAVSISARLGLDGKRLWRGHGLPARTSQRASHLRLRRWRLHDACGGNAHLRRARHRPHARHFQRRTPQHGAPRLSGRVRPPAGGHAIVRRRCCERGVGARRQGGQDRDAGRPFPKRLARLGAVRGPVVLDVRIDADFALSVGSRSASLKSAAFGGVR